MRITAKQGCREVRGGSATRASAASEASSLAQGATKGCSQISRTHPSRDVIFFGQILAKKTPETISVHDVWEP